MTLPSEREVIEPNEHAGRVLDAVPSRDDRILNYPVRTLLGSAPMKPRRRAWRRGAVLDQGREGACVGFGWTQELISTPLRVQLDEVPLPEDAPEEHPQVFAPWLYHQAQRIDEWPGEDYSGTSVLAGAKMLQRLGFLEGYRWAYTKQDLRESVMTVGPVVLGIPWYSGMYAAPGGELRVSGEVVGGHAILVNAYDPSLRWNGQPPREMVRVTNSWGTGWGNYGSAWMDLDVLWDTLIADGRGEVCVPVGRRLPEGATP